MTNLTTMGGETFNVRVEGAATKPALMLSNPLGTDLSIWDGQMADLTQHFRVIRYDPRSHGGGLPGATPSSLAQLGRDALAILDALEIEKTHWLGLSMGGSVGLWLLINAPERIDRAVLANTAARIGTPDIWNARITSVLATGMAEVAAAAMERWFSPAFAARAGERVEAVHTMLRAAPSQGYADACAALRDMDLRASSIMIANPVLIVTGRDDPVVPAGDAAELVEAIAGARHVALDARHLSNIEAEAAFNAAVVAFLTQPARRTRDPARKAKEAGRSSATKATPVKRGGAGRRSNPARSPLKAAPAKPATSKKPSVPKTKTAKAAAKKAEPHRRPAVKKRAGARAATKAAVKRQAPKTKTAPKKTTTRRPTSTQTARGPIKKAKPTKKTAVKAPAKKAAGKAASKKLPAQRRAPVKKPRRPAGRRK